MLELFCAVFLFNCINSLAVDLVINSGDTVRIQNTLNQNGNIIILGTGVLIVDGGTLNLAGHLYLQNNGLALFRNNAYLHFLQQYVGQYYLWLKGNSRFEALDSKVDVNGSLHFVNLYDNSLYTAKRTLFPDWTFRQVYNRSSLVLEDIRHVGDLLVRDSCNISFRRCDTLMPWFSAPGGAAIYFQFPPSSFVPHFVFSDSVSGIDGINYRVTVDSSRTCWWSLESFSGSNVTINNSTIYGSNLKVTGNDTVRISNIRNHYLFPNLVVPLNDRLLRYNNTYVYWWNWYPGYQNGSTVFYMDSCVFGEMISHGRSKVFAKRSTCDGATIHLATLDSSYMSFEDGSVLSFIGTWDRSTLFMSNSVVTPTWPYQSTNIAHENSLLLASNCRFQYIPYAVDSALVMFAAIDSPAVGIINSAVSILGNAWIDAGPLRPAAFQNYKLYWTYADSLNWFFINQLSNEVIGDTLGIWNTNGLLPGNYFLKLVIRTNTSDSLAAVKNINLVNSISIINLGNEIPSVYQLYQNYPNPFNPTTKILFNIPSLTRRGTGLPAEGSAQAGVVVLKVYDALGSEVQTLVNEALSPGTYEVEWDGSNFSSGVYYYTLITEDYTFTRKMVLIK